jgi:hypothetical protein
VLSQVNVGPVGLQSPPRLIGMGASDLSCGRPPEPAYVQPGSTVGASAIRARGAAIQTHVLRLIWPRRKSKYATCPSFLGQAATFFQYELGESIERNVKGSRRTCDLFEHSSAGKPEQECIAVLTRDPSPRPALLLLTHGNFERDRHLPDLDGHLAEAVSVEPPIFRWASWVASPSTRLLTRPPLRCCLNAASAVLGPRGAGWGSGPLAQQRGSFAAS